MTKKAVIISAVAAIVFDLIACIGDSNTVIYNLFMGLTLVAFCVYVYGLFRTGYTKETAEKKEYAGRVRTAYAAE
jgi:Ca2+/Na+ antiporter